MTNDFAVEQQQPQTKKSLGLPLVGVVGGGIAGAALANRSGKYKSYDQIISEVKDLPDFSSKTEPELWQSVKDKVAKVKELEEKLADASKATVTGKPLDDLNAAKEALNAEIARLQERSASAIEDAFPKASEIPEFSKIQASNPNSINWVKAEGKNAGKEMEEAEARRLYNDLRGRIASAEKSLEGAVGPMEKKKTEYIKNVKTAINDLTKAGGALHGADDRAISMYFSADLYEYGTWGRKPRTGLEKIWDVATEQCGDPAKLNEYEIAKKDPEKIISIGHLKEKGERINSYQTTVKVVNEGKTEHYVVNWDDLHKLIDDEKRNLEETRKSTFEELCGSVREYMQRENEINPKALQEKFTNLEDNVVNRNIAERTGLYDTAKGELDVAKLIGGKDCTLKEIQDARRLYAGVSPKGPDGKPTKGPKTGGFVQDLKNMKDTIRTQIENDVKAKNPGITDKKQIKELVDAEFSARKLNKAELSAIGLEGDGILIGKAEEMLNARIDTLRAFEKYVNEFNKESNKLLEETPAIQKLTEEIAEKKSNFEPLVKAREAFINQFGDIEVRNKEGQKVKISSISTATEGTAREITEKDVAQSFRTKLENAQKAFDKAVAERGTVNESAKKSAQEALDAGKKELENAATKLSQKLGKSGGIKKGLGIAIGALGVGGLCYLLAPRKPKNS